MRVCKDCEREYDDSFVGTKTQLCKICYNRLKNSCYLKKEYIKIKDLPLKEQEDVINACMKKRATVSKKKKTIKNIMVKEQITEQAKRNIEDAEILSIVKNDIEDAFDMVGIPQDYLEFKKLPELIEMLFELVVSEKRINDAKEAEKAFNNLGSDYEHLIEEEAENGEDVNRVIKYSLMKNKLKQLRRPTKNVIAYLDILEPVLLKIKQYPIIVKEIEKANETLHEQMHPMYYIKASQYAKKEVEENAEKYKNITANVLSPLHTNKKHFNWQVNCFNLHGNPNRQQFVSEKGIWADNIIDAKFKIKKFLKDYFPNVTYMEKDLIIEEDAPNA